MHYLRLYMTNFWTNNTNVLFCYGWVESRGGGETKITALFETQQEIIFDLFGSWNK